MKNKKMFAIGALIIASIFIVSASLLNYFFVQNINLSIDNEISFSSEELVMLNCSAGSECFGEPITITNSGDEFVYIYFEVNGTLPEGVDIDFEAPYVGEYDDNVWEIRSNPGTTVVTPKFTISRYVGSFDESIDLIIR